MEFVMRSRFSLYLAGLLVFEALIVRGGAPRFPQRQGTLVLAAALQRQVDGSKYPLSEPMRPGFAEQPHCCDWLVDRNHLNGAWGRGVRPF
jgi:hypothetical protein